MVRNRVRHQQRPAKTFQMKGQPRKAWIFFPVLLPFKLVTETLDGAEL